MTTYAVTAVTATRDALVRLWLPPDEVVALAQRADAAGCLSDDAHHWLRRIENERQRQQKSPAVQGEASGQAHSQATISNPSVQEVHSVSKSNPAAEPRHTRDEVQS